jgi:hypothetical protein
MSFTDKLILWLHIAFAIFAIGPVTLAISSTPRYIRHRDVAILRYLSRITLSFTGISLLVLVFGVAAGEQDHDLGKPWLTVAMTLFVVAIVLLVLIIRDQRRAIRALAPADVTLPGGHAPSETEAPAATQMAPVPEPALAAAGAVDTGQANSGAGSAEHGPAAAAADIAQHVASVERGRIAAMGGVVNLSWLVILVLMVWRP